MKAVQLVSLGEFEVKETQRPTPKPNQVIIKVMAAGVCGSDIPRAFTKGPYHFPLVMGHEFSGLVVELGKDVSEKWKNKKVAVFPLVPCNKCEACKQKDYVQCEKYSYYGSREDGGFSEYLAVDEFNLVLMADHTKYTSAAMLEPAAVALHAIRMGKFSANESIAIFGAGTIGLIIAKWAQLAGAKKIMLVDIDPTKIEFAKSLGFEYVCNAREEAPYDFMNKHIPDGVDVCVEASGASQSFDNALLCCRRGGRVVLLGNPHSDMTASRNSYDKFMRKECSMIGVFNSIYDKHPCDEWIDTAEAISNGKLYVEDLITEKVSVEQVPELFNKIFKQDGFVCKGMMVSSEIAESD